MKKVLCCGKLTGKKPKTKKCLVWFEVEQGKQKEVQSGFLRVCERAGITCNGVERKTIQARAGKVEHYIYSTVLAPEHMEEKDVFISFFGLAERYGVQWLKRENDRVKSRGV